MGFCCQTKQTSLGLGKIMGWWQRCFFCPCLRRKQVNIDQNSDAIHRLPVQGELWSWLWNRSDPSELWLTLYFLLAHLNPASWSLWLSFKVKSEPKRFSASSDGCNNGHALRGTLVHSKALLDLNLTCLGSAIHLRTTARSWLQPRPLVAMWLWGQIETTFGW